MSTPEVTPDRRSLHAAQSAGVGSRATTRARRLYRQTTSGLRLLPQFLIIGAARAGTTSLYSYLVRHPSVSAPTHKEIHYFDLNFERGRSWYRRHFPLDVPGIGHGAVSGEASPYYLFHPAVAARVQQSLPDAKLIALLRNPIERAYSQHQLASRHGRETLSFEEAISAEPERLAGEAERMRSDRRYESFAHRHHTYLERGLYAEQLERWYEQFPRSQIFVLKSEDFFLDPKAAYRDVLDFLHLERHELSEYRAFNQRPYADLAPETRAQLRRYFTAPNERLEALLERKLDWD
jgi:hypothetical protein